MIKRRILTVIACVLFMTRGFALSNDALRSIMENPVASIGDAVAVSADIPGAVAVKGLDAQKKLTVGGLAVVLIKSGVLKSTLFYNITGWDRYAAERLLERKLISRDWSWNRRLSGAEMLGVVSRILPDSAKKKK